MLGEFDIIIMAENNGYENVSKLYHVIFQVLYILKLNIQQKPD